MTRYPQAVLLAAILIGGATAAFAPLPAHAEQAPIEPVIVRIETTLGSIVIAVDTVRAPITSANFLKYVDGGFYTQGRFHRATRADNYTVNLPNRPLLECIQAGINPEKRSAGFPPIPLERTSVTGLRHVVGTVSMARGAADTATSDFFILLNDQPSLDFGGKRFDDGQGAAAFGTVVAGLDVVQKIQRQPTEKQNLAPPVTIVGATRMP
ncbi:MAG TPA: peptidylprolyl isomerase [Vicinamibacterales bacterium]|nr:peptidylprolyl isomerase [Vicinamibacterales bacterium]